MKKKIAILKSESKRDHIMWLKACADYSDRVDVSIIDLTLSNWLDKVQEQHYDIFLLRPPGQTSLFKQLYDERIYILNKVLNQPIYPSLEEIMIYENKRFLSYWLQANKISSPKTVVFYNKEEAIGYIDNVDLPIVIKTNIGASGNGVTIVKSIVEYKRFLDRVFSISGIQSFKGPKLFKGNIFEKIKKIIFQKDFIKTRLNEYREQKSEIQRGFILLQEFVPHDFEWRCVRIGDSFFAHKKIVHKEKASGSLNKDYDNPPLSLLDYILKVTDENFLLSVSIDLFESNNIFLVNEIQCFFGQSDPYQMLVDGFPGRYIRFNNKWKFEPGDFNRNESYNLRLEHALNIIDSK